MKCVMLTSIGVAAVEELIADVDEADRSNTLVAGQLPHTMLACNSQWRNTVWMFSQRMAQAVRQDSRKAR